MNDIKRTLTEAGIGYDRPNYWTTTACEALVMALGATLFVLLLISTSV